MEKKELAHLIETAWMEYNAAVVSRLHPEKRKQTLANILINNVNDILDALRDVKVETADVITGDKDDPPKKVRKNGER